MKVLWHLGPCQCGAKQKESCGWIFGSYRGGFTRGKGNVLQWRAQLDSAQSRRFPQIRKPNSKTLKIRIAASFEGCWLVTFRISDLEFRKKAVVGWYWGDTVRLSHSRPAAPEDGRTPLFICPDMPLREILGNLACCLCV